MAENIVTSKDAERQETDKDPAEIVDRNATELTMTTDQFMEAYGRLCVEHGKVCLELAKLKSGLNNQKPQKKRFHVNAIRSPGLSGRAIKNP